MRISRALVPAVLTALALCPSVSALASSPLPLPPTEARASLEAMVHLGAVSRADADRVIVEESLPEPLLAASESPGCGTVALVQTTRWLRDRGVRVSFVSPPGQYHVTSATFPIRVYYNVLGLAAKANDSLLDAEAAWQTQVVERGYRSPWTGGDGDAVSLGMDYYFAVTDGTWSGLTIPLADIPSTPICDCSTRILIDETLGGANLGSTIEHEFNHTTQAATDCGESISAWENFATAVEYLAFPKNYELTHYDMAVFQAWPDYSLDFWTQSPGATGPDEYYQYGASLFPIFLLERFGGNDPVFLKDVWESFKENGTMTVSGTGASCDTGNVPDWFQGVDTLLKTTQSSSLKQAFNEFGEWRAVVGGWDDGAHFVDGKHYPLPTVTVELATFPRSAWLDAREYGTRYLEYVPNSESEGSLVVTITGKTETTWSGAILLWHEGVPVQRVDLVFDDATGIATAETGPLLNVQRVLIFVSQLTDGTHSTDAQDYDNARFFKYAVTQQAGLDAGAPAGPDAAAPGLDASAVDAAIIDGWDTGAATKADGGTSPHSGGGCGCSAAGAPGALVGLLARGLVFLKRRRP